jgi:protein-S-isoprenylcysteine O-methyltransferase Ste14
MSIYKLYLESGPKGEYTMAENERDNAGVIAPPPLIYLGTLIVGLLLQRIFPLKFLRNGLAQIVGVALISAGVRVITSAVGEMRRAETPLNPTQPVKALVVEGPFSFSRNPVYLSLALLYAGIASLVNSLWAMLLLPVVLTVITREVIEREEKYLERKFGDEYVSYKKRVRRWL